VFVVQFVYFTALCRAAQTSVHPGETKECSGTNPGPLRWTPPSAGHKHRQ
jgi:hypothetical protein